MILKFQIMQTVDEALQALEHYGATATILAGGTDVMIQLDRGEINTDNLIHVERLDELKAIELRKGQIEIGALTCHRDIATSALLEKNYTSIRSAAASIGGWQTQSVGTIGGNLCNASPAADLIPPLLLHDAELTLLSRARGTRVTKLNEFLLGRRQTSREADELLTRIKLEPVPAHTADVYLKVGRRNAMEVAIVGLAVRLTMNDEDGSVADIRIATCAVNPTPCRASQTEAILRGERLDAEVLREAGEILVTNSAPIDDIRASANYRRLVLPRLLERALRSCAEKVAASSVSLN